MADTPHIPQQQHGVSSVWPVAQISPAAQRCGRYVAGSGEHPARMLPHLAAYAIDRYSRPSEIVFDPLTGIGTTLVEAVHLGRHAIGVELEQAWVEVASANVAHAIRQGATGTARVVQADAARLPDTLVRELAGRVSLVLTLPPYGRTIHGRVEHRRGPLHRFADSYRASDHANLGQCGQEPLVAGIRTVLAECRKLLILDATIVVPVSPWRRDHLPVGRKRAFFHAALDVVDNLRAPEPDLEEGKPTLADRYADTARKLAQAFSNCPREEKIRSLRPDLEFFEAVRLYLAKLRAEERRERGLATAADVELAIRQLTAARSRSTRSSTSTKPPASSAPTCLTWTRHSSRSCARANARTWPSKRCVERSSARSGRHIRTTSWRRKASPKSCSRRCSATPAAGSPQRRSSPSSSRWRRRSLPTAAKPPRWA